MGAKVFEETFLSRSNEISQRIDRRSGRRPHARPVHKKFGDTPPPKAENRQHRILGGAEESDGAQSNVRLDNSHARA
eukprot:2695221-Pleurochrysis_carterae.AAC.2